MKITRGQQGLSGSNSIWRFAGSAATSQRVILPVLGLLFLNSFVAGLFPEEESRRQQLGVLLVASIAAWLFFTLIGLLIELTLKTLTITRVAAVSVMYALTELIRISTVFAFIDEQNTTSDYGLEFRVAGSLTTGLLFLGASATVFNDSADYRSTFAIRSNRLSLAEAALGQVEADIGQTRAQIVSKVRGTLNTELSRALLLSKSSGSTAGALADELFRVSDGVIRSLSNELLRVVSPEQAVEKKAVSAKVPIRELINFATRAEPFQPLQIAVVSALFTAPTLLLLNAPLLFTVWVFFITAVFALSAFGQRVFAPRLPEMPVALRILLITVLTAPPLAGYVSFAIVPSISGLVLTSELIGYTFILGAFIGWALAIAGGLRSAREQILEELSQLDRQLNWLNKRANCQLWLDQKRLALILHNTVQGNLLAAAMKLKKAMEAGPEATETAMLEVKRLLASSLELESGLSRSRTLAEITAELNNTWAPLIEINMHCQPELAALVSSDPVALEIVAEVMSEFVTNSLKHGRATLADAELTQSSQNLLALRLGNNGSPIIDDDVLVGLGGNFIDSVAIIHQRVSLPDGVEIKMQIPLLVR